VDFIVNKDKRNLWIEYNNLLTNTSSENIYNVFLWQFKTLLLVSNSKDSFESGLSDFVYNKNKRALSKWPKKEIENKYIELLDIQFLNRKHTYNLDSLLEKFILNL
jgi:UTP:GlnB (protein PII) uridylyltransferase